MNYILNWFDSIFLRGAAVFLTEGWIEKGHILVRLFAPELMMFAWMVVFAVIILWFLEIRNQAPKSRKRS